MTGTVGSIVNNINSLYALSSLTQTNNQAGTLEQELSSGKAINSPADNPAGFIAEQGFTTQINGVTQAMSNANQANSLLETADGAIQQQISILQQIRTIADQAANGINTPSELSSLQTVVSQLQDQVSTIANQTQFNNQNLLDGSFQGVQFQVGPNEGQTISLSLQNSDANSIGVYQSAAVSTSGGIYAADGSASGGVADQTGNSYAISSSGTGVFTAGSFGVSGSAGGASVSVSSATESAKDVAASINDVTAKTGVSAVADTSVAMTVTSGSFSFKLGNGTGSSPTNDATISATVGSVTQSGLQPLVDAINAQTQTTGVTASVNSSNQLILTSADGQNISLSSFAGSGTLTAGGTTTQTLASGGTTSATVQGVVTVQSPSSFALGSNASDIGLTTSSSLTAVSKVDVSTVAGANSALNVVDFALQSLQQTGGSLGAIQKRVEALVNNLQTSQVNLTAAKSVIADANIPQVTSKLSQTQILQHAGVYALTQSSALQQAFLKLLP